MIGEYREPEGILYWEEDSGSHCEHKIEIHPASDGWIVTKQIRRHSSWRVEDTWRCKSKPNILVDH